MRLLERVAVILASLALAFGLIALLSGFFQGRDAGQLSGSSSGPGQHFRDMGDALLPPGQLRPAYDSSPPTSGPHVLEPVTRDWVPLNNDQLLSALALGDVVILYGSHPAPQALVELARSVAGPFSPTLAATGQAVILSRDPGTHGFVGLAWTHMIHARRATDPRLAGFTSYWLGRGAPPPAKK
jgi:hypothetical protein